MRTSFTSLISGVVGTLVGGLVVGTAVYYWVSQANLAESPRVLSTSAEFPLDANQDLRSRFRNGDSDQFDEFLRIQSIQDSTKYASGFDQSVSLYVLLARAEQDDLNRYVSESFSISSRNQRVATLSVIFSRYAVLDPSAAVTRALSLTQLTANERSDLIRSIFDEWAVADLDTAVTAIEELPKPFKFTAASAVISRSDNLTLDERRRLTRRVGPTDDWISHTLNNIEIDELKANPRQAYYDRIRDSNLTRETHATLLRIARHWFEAEGVSVLDEIHDSLDNAQARDFVLTNLIWNSVGNGTAKPTEILEVVSGFENKQTAKQAMEYVFFTWSSSKPKEAFEASLEYDNQLITSEFRSAILHGWAQKDAEGLLAATSSLPQRYQKTAITKALGGVALKSPGEAIHYARALDSQNMRMRARDEILKQWSTVDAKSAFDWLMTDGLSGSNLANLSGWHRTFSAYLTQDIESARTYATAYQGELRDNLIEAVAQHLVKWDVEQAIEYLPNVAKTDRGLIQEQIGSELVRVDPIEALKYASKVEPDNRDSYFNTVLDAWAQVDLVSLQQNISRVPREYRSTAARELLLSNTQRNFLSARELRNLREMVDNGQELIADSD